MQTWFLGWNPAVRALTGAATEGAPHCRKKPRHAPSTLRALRPRWPRAKSAQRRRELVGRAVHCAPESGTQTWLLGWNPAVRALTGAATARDPPGRKKPLTRSTQLEGTAAKMAARRSPQRRRESVGRVPHVRDAPPSVHPERSGGQRTARPTSDRVLTKQNPPRKSPDFVITTGWNTRNWVWTRIFVQRQRKFSWPRRVAQGKNFGR